MSASGVSASSSTSGSEFTEQAQEKGREARGQAAGFIRSQLDDRTTQTGSRVRNSADDIRSVAKELRNQGKEGPANLAEQVAGRVEQLGGYLADSDADRMMNDLEDFARRQPWVVGIASLAVGFAAARFLKSSTSQRREVRTQDFGIDRSGQSPETASVGSGTAAPTTTEAPGAPITLPEAIDEREPQLPRTGA